ncbi:MAG: lipoyl synthase [Methanomassiliicoccales archaeon PtaB.Bin134]|nr:MAG: lipoyl synthase [Methanomassiliicoccales archaeon PtaB.Bin134]
MRAVERKAILICGGNVKVSREFRPPFRLSRSTAGPGAGSSSIVLAFDGLRVKKSISREEGEFELVEDGGAYSLLRNGELFLDRVELKPVLYHSPEQAFFNLGQACIFDCLFCTSRKLSKDVVKDLDLDQVVNLVLEADRKGGMKAVAFTSAVVDSISETIERMVYVVSKVRQPLPDIPIGVEPYVESNHDIDRLKEAGATEIKINIESFDPRIIGIACPKLELQRQLEFLRYAVQVFGRGKVTSNIIIGLGETDRNVLEGVTKLASMGIVPTIRALKVNDTNRPVLEAALGKLDPVTPERLLGLNQEAKIILLGHGLSTSSYHTMCHECGCCDLVPFRDL